MRYVLLAVVCIGVTAYVIGSCTEKRLYTHYRSLQDSLGNVVVLSRVREKNALVNARMAFQEGVRSQASKVQVVYRYREDTAARHRLTLQAKDSTVKAELDIPTDSSVLTDPLATKVLDLESENKMLHEEAVIDSATIKHFETAYHEADTANSECHQQNAALVQSSSEAQKELKKTRKKVRLWQVLTGIAVVLACL